MMDFELVELDAFTFEITRRLPLGEGVDADVGHPPHPGREGLRDGEQRRPDLEIDLASWRIERTFETGAGPYNLDVSPDGTRLVATYKNGDAVGFWDLESGGRPPARRRAVPFPTASS